jgi:BirA family biotin operon repressor/biotin-[acetyl-CoA-carboxylase] ligase
LTIICSLAVCDALAQVGGVQAQVKWPNDVLVGNGKICGILTELELAGDSLAYALIGIGINVNVDFSQAPPLMAPATSVLDQTGRSVSRLALLAALLANIEDRYAALQAGASFHKEWAARMVTLGQAVVASTGNGNSLGQDSIQGTAVGVDEDGALMIQVSDGTVKRVLGGDVTLRAHRAI